MPAPTIPERFKRLPVVGAASHLFKLGQAVRLKSGLWPTSNVYLVTAQLPPSGASPQYRIRSEAEKFERMETQANLEVVSEASGGEGDARVRETLDLTRTVFAALAGAEAEAG